LITGDVDASADHQLAAAASDVDDDSLALPCRHPGDAYAQLPVPADDNIGAESSSKSSEFSSVCYWLEQQNPPVKNRDVETSPLNKYRLITPASTLLATQWSNSRFSRVLFAVH